MTNRDRRGWPLALAAMLLLLPLSHAVAAQPNKTAPPKALTGDPSAEAAMQRMRHQFAAATTLNFTCTCTIPTEAWLSPLVISGTLQKPGNIFLTLMHNDLPIGLISVDGSTEYYFDARTRRYVKGVLGSGPDLSDEAASAAALARGSTASILNTVLTTVTRLQAYQMFFRDNGPLRAPSAWSLKQNKAAPPASAAVSTMVFKNAPDVPLEGKLTRHILGDVPFQAVKGEPPISYTENEYYLDKATDLPLYTMDYGPDDASPASRSQQNYSQIQLGNTPVPAATFEWSPPTGAIAVRK